MWEAMGPNYDAGLDLKVLVLLTSTPPLESLNSVRTYVRLVCEWGHRDPAIDGLCGVDARFDLRPDRIRQLVAPNVAAVSEAPIKGLIAGLAVAFGG